MATRISLGNHGKRPDAASSDAHIILRIPSIKLLSGMQSFRYLQGGFFGVDVYVFLVKTDGGYVLVDTGAPVEKSAELLLKGLEETMKKDQLKLVILTHGHPDHIGTLRRVVRAHPDTQVAFHEEEAPYILGEASPFLAWSCRTAAACKSSAF